MPQHQLYHTQCDLCQGDTVVSTDPVPVDWIKIVLEPSDRTFIDKHLCKDCLTKINDRWADRLRANARGPLKAAPDR